MSVFGCGRQIYDATVPTLILSYLFVVGLLDLEECSLGPDGVPCVVLWRPEAPDAYHGHSPY